MYKFLDICVVTGVCLFMCNIIELCGHVRLCDFKNLHSYFIVKIIGFAARLPHLTSLFLSCLTVGQVT